MGVADAVIRLSLVDQATAGVTAFASVVTASVSVINLGWSAVTSTMGLAAGALKGVGTALVGLGETTVDAGKKLFALSEQSAAATNALNDVARSVGVTANQMQSFMNAAGDIGISTGEASTAFRFLQMNIEQAMAGTAKSVESFGKLGVAFSDGTGKARDAYTVMREIGEAMASMSDGSTKTATAIDFFGRSGTRMIPLLSNLDGALESADKQLEDLGQTMSQEMIAAAEKFRLAVGDVGDGVGALNAYLGTAMMGVFGEQAERLAAGIQDLFASIVPELAKLTIALKLGLIDILDKIPFEAIGAKVKALAAIAINAIITGLSIAVRAINGIPWGDISAKASTIITSISTLAAKAWGLLSDLVRQGYTRGWDAAQAFIPMLASLIGGLASNGVSAAKTIAMAFNTAANGAMELFQRALSLSEKVSKTVAFLMDPSAENLKAIQEVSEAQDKMMAEMKEGYRALNNEDALWWAALQQRADSFAANAKTATAPIVAAIDTARSASDKVVDAVNRAAQEMGNLKGQAALSAAQADALKKNFYMSGESAENLAKIAARLGVDLGKAADESGRLAKGTKDAAGSAALYLSEWEKTLAAEAKAKEERAKDARAAKGKEERAPGDGAGVGAGPGPGTTVKPPSIGTIAAGDTTTTTYIGGWGGYGERGAIRPFVPKPPESWQEVADQAARIEARNQAGTKLAATAQYKELQDEFSKTQQYFNESQRRSAEKAVAAVKKQIDTGAFGGAQARMVSLVEDWQYASEQGEDKRKEAAAGLAAANKQYADMQRQFDPLQARGALTKEQFFAAEKAIRAVRKQIDSGAYAAAQDKMSALVEDWQFTADRNMEKEAEKAAKKTGSRDPRRKVPVSAPAFTVGQYGPPSPAIPYQGIVGDLIGGVGFRQTPPIKRASDWIGGEAVGFRQTPPVARASDWMTTGGGGEEIPFTLVPPTVRAKDWMTAGGGGIGSKPIARASDWKSMSQGVDIGTYGQMPPGLQMGQTDPRPADVNIDGEKVGQLILKRYKSGAWTMPKSAVKDSR